MRIFSNAAADPPAPAVGVSDPAPAAAAGDPAGPAAGRRAREPVAAPAGAGRPRGTRAQVLAGMLCAALGFGFVVQVRQTSTRV